MKRIAASVLAVLMTTLAWAEDAGKNPLVPSEAWAELRDVFVGDLAIADGGGVFEVEAPYRAADAATVPVTIRQTDPATTITRATIVIDENPAPLAAEMTFGSAMMPLDLEMRVRVDQYSNVRVIAETTEAGALMGGRFVKASGGCSAPASRDPSEALATMGEMRLRHFASLDAPGMSLARREAQIMIRHPNYSGLQRDQITQLFVPAHFIDRIEVWQGEEMLWTLSGGISISENPVFRFRYDDNGAADLRVRARDTEGNTFERVLSKATAS